MRETRTSLTVVVLALICIGIIMIYSASCVNAMQNNHDSLYYLKRHLFFLLIGLIMCLAAMAVDYRLVQPYARRLLLASIIMICGGSDKHLSFSSLKDLVKRKVKAMVVIGQTKEILRSTFADIVPVEVCGSLQEAVETARRAAKPGDCVVLSPMCASFDMFKDYEHRGRVFKEICAKLGPH